VTATVLAGDDPGVTDRAVEALAAGSVVAIPTDTVYGLAVDPFVPGAVDRLFEVKGRPRDVPIPLLIGDLAAAGALGHPLPPGANRLAKRLWPGPLTLVVPRRPEVVLDLGGPADAPATVGIRWPDHALVTALCRRVGPLAVTSANMHGERPSTTAADVVRALGGSDRVALVLDGGACAAPPSTVVSCLGNRPVCLRVGAVAWSDVVDAWA
jgi:L-threonylcarbamoyladenylate synthase